MTTAISATRLEALLLEEIRKDPLCASVARVKVEATRRADGQTDWDAKAYHEDGGPLSGQQRRAEIIAKASFRGLYHLLNDA